MARTLKQFREQHQEFNALSDQELADGLHHKYFSDIPKERFYKQIDFAPEQPLDEYTPLSPMLAEATAGVFSRPNAPQEDASPPMSDYLGMESPAPEQVSPGPMDEHERRRLAAKQQPTVSVKPPSEWEDPTLPEPRSILDQAREEGDVKQYTSALNAATAPGEQPALPSDMMDAESPAPNVVTPGEMSEHERRRLADPTRSGIGNWKDTTVNDPTGNFFPESRENESILDQAKREGDAKWYNDTLSDVGTTAKRILLSPKEGVEAMAVFEQERARQSQQLMEEALGPNAPQEMRDRIRTEAESEVAQAKKLEDYLSSIKTPDKVYNEGVASWIEDSLYGIGQSAIPMMATMVSPAIGYLMQHAMIAGDKLKEYKAQGINPRVAWESANLAASLQAPFETALDVVELGQLKKMFLGEGASSFVAKFMKGILTNAASEGFEELSQAHMEVIADIFAQNPQITPQELTRKVLDTWKSSDFQKNAWTAAGLGATGGALMFGIGGAVGSLTNKVLAPKRALTMRVVVSNGTDTANVEYNSRTKKVTDAPEGMEDLIGKPIEDAMSALKSNNFNTVREEMAAMRAIKTALDPNGIMNPGAVLRA